eukprot:scaffold16.g101.t1
MRAAFCAALLILVSATSAVQGAHWETEQQGMHVAQAGAEALADKSSWAELVGKPVHAVVALLQAETGLRVIRVPDDAMVTADYREERIRVFFDPKNKLVVREPRIG